MSKFSVKLQTTLFKPVGIASMYLVFSALWIVYSDKFLGLLIVDDDLYAKFQTVKGIFFVVSTAFILYLFVRRGQRELQKVASRAEEHKIRYRELVDSSPFIIAVIRNNRIVYINKAGVEIFETKDASKLIGKSIKLVVHPEYWESAEERNNHILAGGQEDRIIREECISLKGKSIPIESRFKLITYNGEPAVQVIAEDVSERLRREQALEQMVKEKTVLLSEVHHRVKNNMAIISALMQLQSYETGNEEVAEILDKSISQIKSIALIHENLYEVQNLSEIELAKNIRDLVQQISRRYSKETDVWFSYDLQEIRLTINQAVSVGLFLNEVISELFKASAFSITREVIIATSQIDNTVTISISEKLAKKNISRQRMFEDRGFLIDLMAQQLDGDLVLNQTEEGFVIALSFSKSKTMKGSTAHQLIVD